MHDKFALFGRRISAHGSINWSHHAPVSSGLMVIHDDETLLSPVVMSFDKKIKSHHLVKERELRTICKWYARHKTASAHRDAYKQKRAAKRAVHRMKKMECLALFA